MYYVKSINHQRVETGHPMAVRYFAEPKGGVTLFHVGGESTWLGSDEWVYIMNQDGKTLDRFEPSQGSSAMEPDLVATIATETFPIQVFRRVREGSGAICTELSVGSETVRFRMDHDAGRLASALLVGAFGPEFVSTTV